MANPLKKKRNQKIVEAEGYLDLILACSEIFALDRQYALVLADKALHTLAEIEENSGRSAHIHYLAGQAHRICDRHELAIKNFNESLEFDSENVHVYLALGWSFKRSGKLQQAIESLERALEIEPESGILNYNLACYWALADQVDFCVGYLSTAIEIDESYRDHISGESDFDSVRQHPEFMLLTTAIA